MAKKQLPEQDDYEIEDFSDEFDDEMDDGDYLQDAVDNIFNVHFTKLELALKLTELALNKSTVKADNEEHVFETFRRALRVISETGPMEETLHSLGMGQEHDIKRND